MVHFTLKNIKLLPGLQKNIIQFCYKSTSQLRQHHQPRLTRPSASAVEAPAQERGEQLLSPAAHLRRRPCTGAVLALLINPVRDKSSQHFHQLKYN